MKHNGWRLLSLLMALMLLTMAMTACNQTENKDALYSLSYKNTTLSLGANADPVVASLGTPVSTTEIGDCGGKGAQVKYVYADLTLYVLKAEDGNTIDAFALNHDMVSTDQGVSIGDEKDHVLEHYGEPTGQSANKLEYQDGNRYLIFDLEEKQVVSIEWKIVG
ncbi:MAG: hypothetical protein IJY42_05630 [Clostridia bacterium]|nr:hypothetical protein [Clostridia bacterium]